ncbi:cell division protein FtsW [Corynebacterium sp. 32222D000AT]|uniref:cell division protein FtsW n=2 Tax=unclassified Corynebacterium TaxID=2624378 RepID=UPI002A95FD41|nr:cell division protein FtsW [Corynebacterium sp.]
MVVASFYISQVTGWRGVASPNEKGVSWSEVSSEGLLGYSAQFLAFYYLLVLPFFLVRRHRWKKRDNRGTGE